MKQRIFKTRDNFGQPVYKEYTDLDGVIAIGIAIAHEQPDNPRAQALITWLKELGRKPTDNEFREWVTGMGAQIVQENIEDFEN